jgi:alanyl-tRNA synthetase
MTEALYYQDPRLARTSARMASVARVASEASEAPDGASADGSATEGWIVELDRTIFYPEGGGQPADRGTIGGLAVTDVRKEGQRILHTVAGKPGGDEVDCRLDWPRRWDFMQQHTGQHLLSSVLAARCGAATVSIHLGDEVSTIEVDREALADGDLAAVEDRAAELIAADLPVTSRWVDDAELAALALRRPTQRRGSVRIVEIGDVDRVACGGLHVARTAEVQLVRLARVERIRGRLRTHWKIGRRALLDYRVRARIVDTLGEELSAPPDGVAGAVAELRGRLDGQDKALEAAARRIARSQAAALVAGARLHGARRIVTAAFEGEAPDFLRRVGQELASEAGLARLAGLAGLAFCLTNHAGGRLQWVMGADAKAGPQIAGLLPRLLATVDGRGGGKPPLWQGIASRPGGVGELLTAFEAACIDAP